MSYHEHRSTPPRSILVIVGGLIAWAGLVGGVLVATPEYHRALTMKSEPVELTWQKLVDQGLTDNSYVRLIGVELDQDDPDGLFEEMFAPLAELGPDATVEEQQAAFEQFAAEPLQFAEFAEMILRPIKVIPQGVDADQIPASVVIPPNPLAMEAAIREIEESGTLTGRFTPGSGSSLEAQITEMMLANTLQSIEPGLIADEGDANAAVENADAGEIDGANHSTRWVFEPVDTIPNASEAQQWFWISGLAVAVGLVVCGAGGPSITCCVLFQCPSILSLFGYPLRYGRGGKTARIIYAGIGLGLLSYGYQKMVIEGGFGQLDGDVAMSAIGFVVGAFGAAALLGSGTNLLAHRLNLSLDPKPTKRIEEPAMSMVEACSLEPTEKDLSERYIDPELIDSEPYLEIPDSLDEISQALAGTGFDQPHWMAWREGEQSRAALIQLGCQEMVIAEAEELDGQCRLRLVSVLQDGLAIVTLSEPMMNGKSSRFGTSGLYSIFENSDPVAMLSSHLDQTVSMAEKRDTAVVNIDTNEMADVVLYGRRVLTDIRAQYGEESAEVGPATYGRFEFPVAEIPELVAS